MKRTFLSVTKVKLDGTADCIFIVDGILRHTLRNKPYEYIVNLLGDLYLLRDYNTLFNDIEIYEDETFAVWHNLEKIKNLNININNLLKLF